MATVSTAFVQLTGAAPALASPGLGTPVVVSLGDSFISGEGGRWAGTGDNPQTDRGFGVYGDTKNYAGALMPGGCHRSQDSAPVRGALASTLGVSQVINIACSGAQTVNVWQAATGGQPWKVEAPQTDQLDAIARDNDVKAIVLSIGGNDMKFADIVGECVKDYIVTWGLCRNSWDSQTRVLVDNMMVGLFHAITDIRSTMLNRGYQNSQYRIIVESYPTPIADKANLRGSNLGCQVYGDDADWVNKFVIPRLQGAIRQVVRSSNNGAFNNAQFLDLSGAFRGHELCNKNAQFSLTARPAREVAEWANWIESNPFADKNRVNESVHPNFFGQQALQECVKLMLNGPSAGNFRCTNAGAGQFLLSLSPLGPIWSSYGPAQVRTAQTAIPAGTCVFAATNAGRLCFQTDGNLVNYRGSTAVWSSGTHATGGSVVMQQNGDLVVKASSGQVVWHSDTTGNPDAELVVNDGGWVNILNPGGTAVWMSGTTGGGSPGGPGGGGGSGPPSYEN
jgi:hypothetical protein